MAKATLKVSLAVCSNPQAEPGALRRAGDSAGQLLPFSQKQ